MVHKDTTYTGKCSEKLVGNFIFMQFPKSFIQREKQINLTKKIYLINKVKRNYLKISSMIYRPRVSGHFD